MKIQRISAFSDGDSGGNPAGVVIADSFPTDAEMQRVAAEVGFSETAFAVPLGEIWRVRYFSPLAEVPFCGHATIALGAALARGFGDGLYRLKLNQADITVEGSREGVLFAAALQSPPTHSAPASPLLLETLLDLFGYGSGDLDPRIPPARINAGVEHAVLALKTRGLLAAMRYEFEEGRRIMEAEGLTTLLLVYAEGPNLFHARNPFASGGVYEDPATGAAAAALAGYLRDLGWPHGGRIDIVQGEDMGRRSLLGTDIPPLPGGSIRVSGTARFMDASRSELEKAD